ncbi:MAG: T9SS type A sorting domain-containing protein [Patescibacteria group bacterium]
MKAFKKILLLVVVWGGSAMAQIVNGWEVLPSIDINGNWFFDKEKTFSQLGAGFQIFNIVGNTHLNGGENYVKADNLKDFFYILPADKRILRKYMGFRYRISKLVGNVSGIMIIIGVQDNIRYISNNSMGEYTKNPAVGEWREIKFETKEVTNRITSFYKLRFEAWVVSPQSGYVGMSFDVDVLFGEDSLGVRTVYDNFDITSVPRGNSLPTDFVFQNYPNPFNPTTKIRFSIPESGNYTLKVYNTLGQEVATLIDAYLAPGVQEYNFNGANLPSGTYIYRLTGNNISLSNKMMLIK